MIKILIILTGIVLIYVVFIYLLYVPRRLKCLQELTSFSSLQISSDSFSGAVVAVNVASKNVLLVDTFSYSLLPTKQK